MVAELGDGKARGRGECVPYARYGESVESVIAALEAMRPQLAAGLDRAGLADRRCRRAPPATRSIARSGTSRPSAAGRPVHELAGLPAPHPLTTAFTISLAAPAAMAQAAGKAAHRALLKIKLGGTRRRSGAHRRGARGRAEGDADRRRQ